MPRGQSHCEGGNAAPGTEDGSWLGQTQLPSRKAFRYKADILKQSRFKQLLQHSPQNSKLKNMELESCRLRTGTTANISSFRLSLILIEDICVG